MEKREIIIRKAAVLGAGVMGAQIAAHLANANVATFLFDLPAKEGGNNAIVNKALVGLTKLKPSPVATKEIINAINPANYADDLAKLSDCDLIIEAIGERMDWKTDLYKKIAPHLSEKTIFVSNTSGLSINKLAQALPENLRERFFGIHFFNPPRYMRLTEIIPGNATKPTLLPIIETFLTKVLGKGVVYAKDTPNFIANRVGVFSMLATMYHATRLNIPFEVVDALTGTKIGRPKSATFRTADVVGLDTLMHVVNTMAENLTEDPWHSYYQTPEWIMALIERGALGQKTKAGIYQKRGKDIYVLDLATMDYRIADKKPSEEILAILKINNPQEKFAALVQSELAEAQFLWSCFRDTFHYAAFHLAEIAETVRDIDLAIRWGFGWRQGPFEIWQQAGWQQVLQNINADIKIEKTMAKQTLPDWVNALETFQVYTSEGAYAPATQVYQGRSSLQVYQRQLFPEPVLNEEYDEGITIFETNSARLWHQSDDVAILSFKTKMNTIDDGVMDAINEAIAIAEHEYKGLIIWQRHGQDFSAGANLMLLTQAVQQHGPSAADAIVKRFQETCLALKHAMVPTVAAIRGRVFGGGCEISMQCSRVVAALESYIGLVEVGVGLLPAGGGTKEFALRAAEKAVNGEVFKVLQTYFKQIAMAEVCGSAIEAKQKNYLKPTDIVVFNPDEILFVAKQQVASMWASGYRAPLSCKFPVSGKAGIANLQMQLVNMREGGFISGYDYFLGNKIAEVICGGRVEQGSMVDEHWMIELERAAFIELLTQELTQERIKYTLTTGKPLRN